MIPKLLLLDTHSLSVGIGADIKAFGKRFFNVFISGENLTDVAYQNHLSRLKYVQKTLQQVEWAFLTWAEISV